ncbi:L-cysteine desulfidase family protein [Tannockella kyphosi]|uniref:L-cysteine desulfidase family protein n=1 Tax=Tannockella kyphosi TaxID=2899121 RepID=UPI0020127065|nr:L-serine ammonia-lyase, iron-sulfur-dependent, subunit alpha [Tannockella kyphosi]
MEEIKYKQYIQVLKEELIPAMGCTEPIALAYAGAKARDILGNIPEKVIVEVSGNIVKNVKSVIVPNTNGLKGIDNAVLVGIIAGDASKKLEVISNVSQAKKEELRHSNIDIQVLPKETKHVLDILLTVFYQEDVVKVRILDRHNFIQYIEKNGDVLENNLIENKTNDKKRDWININDIYEFATNVKIEDIKDVIQRQIDYNMAIANEGMKNDYGANIGKTLIKIHGDGVFNRSKAYSAAGSDARMGGCELPVIINSGSGNQGMTVSIPVIVYASEEGHNQEKLYRALVLANLVAIHQKTGIGALSAYCGAISAGVGAGTGISFLQGGDLKAIKHTIVNALAILSGMVCDGAKPSCAAKIAASVDAGIFGYQMYQNGQQFLGGDGLVSKGVENTISNIGRLSCQGMKSTDEEIIRIMTDCN